jgi:16S rRNA (adenine1518-N6/adenine1519-N6)-dimethyltransferase
MASAAANIEIAHMDFLDYELGSMPAGYKLAGNLPYYITTPIIMKAMESDSIPALMVFMIQKEVAGRITASPGGKEYGAISVAVRYRCRAEYAMDVSREVFMPKPNVDSAVIRLRPESGLRGTPRDEKLFFAVIKAGFGQRRKMLRNALKEIAGSAERLEAAFENSGVKGTARAETLDVEEFIALSDALL